MTAQPKNILSVEDREHLFKILKNRFQKNNHRHSAFEWTDVLMRLEKYPEKLWSLLEMEESGGEPDVIGKDADSGGYLFCDCSAESPKGRRSICYDYQAWSSRKEPRPKNNAMDMAESMGIRLLNEEQYKELQKLESFDSKTSSWLETPPEMRKKGGALFGDFRFGQVFIYHNGAASYYSGRGFRGFITI